MIVCWACRFYQARGVEEPLTYSPIEGTWGWEFVMPDTTTIHPTLRIERSDTGEWKATTQFRPGMSLTITNLVTEGNHLRYTVVRESVGKQQFTEYRGTVLGDLLQGTIKTYTSGSPKEYPWVAKRNVNVEGQWKWTIPASPRSRAFRLSASEDSDWNSSGIKMALALRKSGERLYGKLRIGRSSELEIRDGRFRDGMVSFQIERPRDGESATNTFRGRLVADRIVGIMISQANGRSRTNQWKATRTE